MLEQRICNTGKVSGLGRKKKVYSHIRCKTSTQIYLYYVLDKEDGGICEQVQQHPEQRILTAHIEPL